MTKQSFKKIETFTITGANPGNNYQTDPHLNGDAHVCFTNAAGLRIIAVIDGAKAPFPYDVAGQPNDAFASNLMADLIQRHFSIITSLDLWEDAMDSTILAYKTAFDLVRMGLPQYHHEDYSVFNGACAFAILIMDEKTGDCVTLQATDCYIVARKNGVCINLSNYDEKAIEQSGLVDRGKMLSDFLADGMSLEEAQKMERQRVIGNRKRVYNKCQSPNYMGMAVMNGSFDLMNCMQVDQFNVYTEGYDGFVLMSDGYMCKHDNIEQTAEGALTQGVEGFYQNEIVPLWENAKEGRVMTDVTCVAIQTLKQG